MMMEHTTAVVAPVAEHWMEQEIVQWSTTKDRSNDPSHHEWTHLWKEGWVLINDALNTFYLQLYGVRDMVKDYTNSDTKPAAATWATLSD